MTDFFRDKEILITGGTGSLSTALTKLLLNKHHQKGIRLFSRSEFTQWQVRQEIDSWDLSGNVSFLIGDVRDVKRLKLAMDGANIVIHAAAMKQVPMCEENPVEAIKTNIGGALNVVEAALACPSVDRVMGISSDKSVYPVNLYGITKAVSEKLFIQGNVYSKGKERRPRFSICRYGNVVGSRGSIIPLFRKQAKETGIITVTHEDMSRFWVTLPKVAEFVLRSVKEMQGCEIFVPRMPSAKVIDIARMIMMETDKPCDIETVGVRPGEKMHEMLITKEESKNTCCLADRFIICPAKWDKLKTSVIEFVYSSDGNDWWLSEEELKEMIG